MRSTGVLVFALLFFVASVPSKSRNDYDQFYCDNFEAKDNNDSEVQYDDDYDSEFQYDDSGLQYYDDYDFEIEHDQFYYDADDYSEPSDDDFRGPDFKACIFHASLEQIIDIQTAKCRSDPIRPSLAWTISSPVHLSVMQSMLHAIPPSPLLSIRVENELKMCTILVDLQIYQKDWTDREQDESFGDRSHLVTSNDLYD
ncbi:hypothetical protein QR680_003551 [Steinernema hermaphroditum]|uniref:Uncharacterized protein n=1 Tax=Steinernema hermaphroditum TaxID=289476 RepID=A0AA39HN40_9BILA|nr:hypothetical protein QR680_003551 [Steinernema hermaphroditum]